MAQPAVKMKCKNGHEILESTNTCEIDGCRLPPDPNLESNTISLMQQIIALQQENNDLR